MDNKPYLEIYSILSLHKASGTEKGLFNDEVFVDRDMEYASKLMKLQRAIMRYIYVDCPKGSKASLLSKIKAILSEENLSVFAYEFEGEIRRIEVVNGSKCCVRIQQKNIFYPSDMKKEEWFND